MKRSELKDIVAILGYDANDVSVLILDPDEIQVRLKKRKDELFLSTETSGVAFMPYSDDFPESAFYDIGDSLDRKAPVPLGGDIASIRFDWRGVTVRIINGLDWQIPYEAEPDWEEHTHASSGD